MQIIEALSGDGADVDFPVQAGGSFRLVAFHQHELVRFERQCHRDDLFGVSSSTRLYSPGNSIANAATVLARIYRTEWRRCIAARFSISAKANQAVGEVLITNFP